MKKADMMLKRKTKENIFCFCVVIIFVLQWLLFWLYANFNSIRLAFTEFNIQTETHVYLPYERLFENFKNFINDVFDNVGGRYIFNGAIMHLLNTLVCLPFSYMIAFIIYKKLPGTGFFKVTLYLPSILSAMVTILLFRHFVEGFLDEVWFKLFNKSLPFVMIDPKYNWWVVGTYIVFFGLPGNLLINIGSISRVPPELVEYGELEGISLFKEFTTITLPLVFPVLQVQCLGLFVGFFTAEGPLYSLYAGKAPENLITFGYYMFTSVYEGRGGVRPELMYGYNSAANLLIGVLSVPIVQITKKLFDLFDPEAEY